MAWFQKVKNPKIKNIKPKLSNTPSGMWQKCKECEEILQTEKLENNLLVCPYCEYHFRLDSKKRLDLLIDTGSFEEHGKQWKTTNPLNFVDKKNYQDRLEASYESTGMYDSTICGLATIEGQKVALAIMDFTFMGGSMGIVTGEKVAKAMDLAFEHKVPCIVVSCSGGARMQEGILSLMQMAKTSASRNRLKENNIPYISLLTDPTTGGVAASYAMLGDLNIAEPKALIGFAGPRVIEQTIRQKLPAGFQRSEFLLEHGFVDRIIPRNKLKAEIAFFIKMFS